MSLSGAEAVVAGVPASFVPSSQVIDFRVAPWSEVTYAYPTRPAARVDISMLPESMRHELAWWLHSLHLCGERVNSYHLVDWVKVAAALPDSRGTSLGSFVDLSPAEWVTAGRRLFHDRHGRLPAATFEGNHRSTITRLHAALSRCYDTGEWWRSDRWDPRRDPRIPLRDHEALGSSTLNFVGVPQPWLKEAIKWYFAVSLEAGNLVWSSLPGFLTYLGSYLSEFLSESGIDAPALVAEPQSELRGFALRFLAQLRQRRSRQGRSLATP